MSLRSTTGCYTCKTRKKKCDETHPRCQRCIRAGLECGGYAPLGNPDGKGIMRRPKAPLPPLEPSRSMAKSSQIAPPTDPAGSAQVRQVVSQEFSLVEEIASHTRSHRSSNPRYYMDAPPSAESNNIPVRGHQSVHFDAGSSLWIEPSAQAHFPNTITGGPLPISHPVLGKQVASSSSSSSGMSASTKSSSSRSSDQSREYSSNIRPTNPPVFTTSGQASLFQAMFSLAEPETDLAISQLSSPADLTPPIAYGPTLPFSSTRARGGQIDIDDGDDPEGVTQALCQTIVPDPNTQDNALAFVLQSYARWIKFTVFDPSRVIHLIRDAIVIQFSSSQESRTRVILISNVIGSLGKSPELNARGLSLVALLRTETHRAMERCHHPTGSAEQPDDNFQKTLRTLDHMIEMILIQRYTSPLSNVIKLMQDAAPVFRKACPEPPKQLVNLPNILLGPGLNLRHFAATDVIVGVTNARPMLFKYDVSHTPEMAEQMANDGLGLQWLHGIPDQLVVLLAWINVLYEDFGTYVDPQCILDIEKQIRNIKIGPSSESADPFATVWRLVVQECWRQAAYIYLYMMLCGAQADDSRVMKAVAAFTRLVDGVRPGRNPDSFLFIPIMIAGASAYAARDRDILRRRMLGLRECVTPGTAGYECLMILVDVWERTEAENRPAVWRDLRIASLKVAGV